MTGTITADDILAFSRQANETMDRLGILPSPENYELWFAHASQRNAALVAALDKAVSEGRATDLAHSKALYGRFFGQGASQIFEEIGSQLSAELEKIRESVDQSGTDTAAFDTALSRAGADLASGTTDIKAVIARLAAATSSIQAQNRQLEAQLRSSTQEVEGLRSRMETVRKESLTDALTGLANRRRFDEGAREAVDAAIAGGQPLSLIISDVDHFKKFNDTYGHAIGDQVLRLVAQCLKSNVKGQDLAARFGGEEFVVLLPNTTLQNASALATAIRKTVESKKIVQKSSGRDMGTVTLSLGVAQFVPGEQIADLLNRADACLYAAKRSGRNRVMTEIEMRGEGTVAEPQVASGTVIPERSQDSLKFEYAVRAMCRGSDMPLRSQVDLRNFHRFARWMAIAEPDFTRGRIMIRQAGSGLQELMGKPLAGLDYLDIVDPKAKAEVLDSAAAITRMPTAAWQITPCTMANGQSINFEFTTFPMLHDTENRQQLLILIRHDLEELPADAGVPRPGVALHRSWIDLGRGIPGSVAKAQRSA